MNNTDSEHSIEYDFRDPSEVEFNDTKSNNPRLSNRRKNIFQYKKKRRISPTDLKEENIEKDVPKKRWCCFFNFK